MNILFIIKVNICVLVKGLLYMSLHPPLVCWLMSLELTSCFEHTIQSLWNACVLVSILWATPNHTLLKYRCPITTSNWIIHIHLTTYIFSTIRLTWQRLIRNPLVVHNHKKQLKTKGGLTLESELQNTWGSNGLYSRGSRLTPNLKFGMSN